MSNILLIAHKPPFEQRGTRIEAANHRTWQLLQPLLDDGHSVLLCVDNSVKSDLKSLEDWGGRLNYKGVPFRRPGWAKVLQEAHDEFQPDCIVAIDIYQCLHATKLRTTQPIWMDIYGDFLTIIQAACFRAGSDRGLPTSIAFARQVLKRGDIFSVCSAAQAHSLVGELAMAGRLNRRTFGYDFVRVIQPGAPRSDAPFSNGRGRPILRKHGVKEGDFVVLWCGGYNTWTDINTLFDGLEWAMSRQSNIHFVSLGENTYKSPGDVYSQFLRKIDGSAYSQNFHMLGWVPWEEVADYYAESGLGLNIDALHYETIYGTRTRLLEMMAAGVPTLTSLGCELSYILREKEAGLTFDIGDSRGLGEQILEMSRDRYARAHLAEAAHVLATTKLSSHATAAPLLEWTRDPCLAPDKTPLNRQQKMKRIEHHARAVARQVIWHTTGLDK